MWGGETETDLRLLHTFAGQTADRDVLDFLPDAPLGEIRVVRIVTTQSPSWVAWYEIEID